MTEAAAQKLAKRALPCPFCGERLISKSDHHGFWVAHDQEPGACFNSTAQLMGEADLLAWNTRATHQEPRRCMKCQSPMIHSRLSGYQCLRGCQP